MQLILFDPQLYYIQNFLPNIEINFMLNILMEILILYH